jgi:hypothetical protein
MTTLMDTVRIEAPERSPVQPAAPLDCPRDTASVSHSLERSYPVEFRGYPRTQWEQMAMSSGSPWPMSRGQPWPSHRPSSNAARPRIEPAGREPHDAAVLRVMSSYGRGAAIVRSAMSAVTLRLYPLQSQPENKQGRPSRSA